LRAGAYVELKWRVEQNRKERITTCFCPAFLSLYLGAAPGEIHGLGVKSTSGAAILIAMLLSDVMGAVIARPHGNGPQIQPASSGAGVMHGLGDATMEAAHDRARALHLDVGRWLCLPLARAIDGNSRGGAAMIDRARFFTHVRGDPFGGAMSQGRVDGCNAILDAWETWCCRCRCPTRHDKHRPAVSGAPRIR
jgi:hypothetical protein